uniref:Uncharacterized protein n=1 Tax=Oryza sativa subsp. japonica TaxID=39947 RepID=Q69TW9_ORYSJ|nr:hypothetical protein [Oryza sativa Japonica Group]
MVGICSRRDLHHLVYRVFDAMPDRSTGPPSRCLLAPLSPDAGQMVYSDEIPDPYAGTP